MSELLERSELEIAGTLGPGDSPLDVQEFLPGVLPPITERRVRWVPADLHADEGWPDVMDGAASLIHIAASVPRGEPKDRERFIAGELAGVERVLRAAAAAGVTRIVLTSSMAAVLENARPGDGPVVFGPDDWTKPRRRLPAYTVAKTRGERLAWTLAQELDLALTTICPAMVFGPLLGGEGGASMGFLEAIARGSIPKVPPTGFEIVDVRDVAEAHVRALQRDDLVGHRVLLAAGYRSMKQMANVVQEAWPDLDVPTEEMPRWLVHVFARFIPEMRTVERNLGVERRMDGRLGETLLTNGYRSPEQAIEGAVRSILASSD